MNIGESLWPDPVGAARRVRQMQCKLHQWAVGDPGRRFDDVFNLVYHPDFLTVAWERVAGNKGARTAGVDRVSPASIAEDVEVERKFRETRLYQVAPISTNMILSYLAEHVLHLPRSY